MSKLINITPQDIEEVKAEFNEYIESGKFTDGKISFSRQIGTVIRKCTIKFTETAYLKMKMLVANSDKELAWHGIVERGDEDGKDIYCVLDILVYPQEVTGATVNTDQEEYQNWLMQQPDEIFNGIRLQGHSHVNMGTSPSAVDNSLYDRIIEQLDDDMFYIFMIVNKRDEMHIQVYDMAKNTMFETSDCDIEVSNDFGIVDFVHESESMIKTKTPAYSSAHPTSYQGYPAYYGGYYGDYYSVYGTSAGTKKSGKKKKSKPDTVASFFEDDEEDDF